MGVRFKQGDKIKKTWVVSVSRHILPTLAASATVVVSKDNTRHRFEPEEEREVAAKVR